MLLQHLVGSLHHHFSLPPGAFRPTYLFWADGPVAEAVMAWLLMAFELVDETGEAYRVMHRWGGDDGGGLRR